MMSAPRPIVRALTFERGNQLAESLADGLTAFTPAFVCRTLALLGSTITAGIAWKTELPGAGNSSPIVVGKRIFLTAYTDWNAPGQSEGSQEELKRHVLCLNRADGKIVWKTVVPSKLPEQEKISTPVSDGPS